MNRSKWINTFFLLVYSLCVVFLAYIPSQSDFYSIIVPFSISFVLYIYFVFADNSRYKIKQLLILGLFLRFVLIFSFPNLSDDIYRFIWDARCLHNGINPFEYLPSEIIGQYKGLDQDLFLKLNSPDYYSIYPPIGQYIGYLASYYPSIDYQNEAIIFKAFIFLAELGSIYFILKILILLELNQKKVLIYTLNPLILVELLGNIHFEAFMVFFLLLGIWAILKMKNTLSAFAIALSISSKLLPLMFLPLFMAHLKKLKPIFIFNIIVAVASVFLFATIMNVTDLMNVRESVDLYVQKFEFNGGLYYLARAIGYYIKGFNIIHIVGPLFSILTVLLISIQGIYYFLTHGKKSMLITFMLMAFTTYLVFATIVHPWYIATPIALCLFTKYRFPILWSGLIYFTYINYSSVEYHEQLWIVGIEYTMLYAFMLYEFKFGNAAERLRIISSK